MGKSTLWPRLDRWHLLKTSAQNTVTSTSTDVTWDSGTQGPKTVWSSGSTVTIQQPGLYLICTIIAFDGNATGYRHVKIMVNGAMSNSKVIRSSAIAAYRTRISCGYVQYLNKGDTVKIQAVQNSGGNLNVDNSYSFFAGVRLGKA